MSTPLAGKFSAIAIGAASVTLNMQEWKISPEGSDIDMTGFNDNGSETGLVGIVRSTISIQGMWDSAQNPHVLGLCVGNTTSCTLGLNQSLSLAFVGSMRVLSAEVLANVDKGIMLSVRGKANGAWTYPGDSSVTWGKGT